MQRLAGATLAIAALALAGCQSAHTEATASLAAYAPTESGQNLTSGLAGTAIGLDLSAKDRRAALAAEYRALEYGQTGAPIAWRGRSVRGEVVAGPLYKVNDYDCRQYTHTITIKGKSETARGTACRAPDGAWQPVA